MLRDGIEGFLDHVHESHRRVLAAQGQLGGGAARIWEQDFTDDKGTLTQLLEAAPREPMDYQELSLAQVEEQLAVVHQSSGKLKKLRDKYNGVLQKDDEWRKMRDQQMQRR